MKFLYSFLFSILIVLFSSLSVWAASCTSGNCQNGYGTAALDNGGEYRGYFENGMPSGMGEMYRSNGDVYKGRFARGTHNGKGILIFSGGYRYEGGFKDGMFQGLGVWVSPAGSKYEGHFHKGKFSGRGTYISASGNKYIGEYEDGFRSGDGRFYVNGGDLYEGQFRNDWYHGVGKYSFSSGKVYEGEFRKAKYHGKGKLSYANGNVYEGEFQNGKLTGKGSYFITNGDLYEGQVRDGKFHGEGKYNWANGFIYYGQWIENQMVNPENIVSLSENHPFCSNPVSNITDRGPTLVGREDRWVVDNKILTGGYWKNGSVLKVGFDFSGTYTSDFSYVCKKEDSKKLCQSRVRNFIIEQASKWSEGAHIYFEQSSSWNESDIRIKFDTKDKDKKIQGGAWSHTGKGERGSKQTMNLDKTWWGTKWIEATIIHEFGHAIGFFHEHKRPDMPYIFDEEEILAHYKKKGWSESDTRHNVIDRLYDDSNKLNFDNTNYDDKSIMRYSLLKKFIENVELCPSSDEAYCVESNEVLSACDLQGASRIYPKPELEYDANRKWLNAPCFDGKFSIDISGKNSGVVNCTRTRNREEAENMCKEIARSEAARWKQNIPGYSLDMERNRAERVNGGFSGRSCTGEWEAKCSFKITNL